MPTVSKGQKRHSQAVGNADRVVRKNTSENVAGDKANPAVGKLHAESAQRWVKVFRALAK